MVRLSLESNSTVKRFIDSIFRLALSATAKDTFILFAGNATAAFLGFLFVLFAARFLTVSDFGVFSAVINLVTITSSVADLGLSAGLVNFISEAFSQKKGHLANRYIKSAFIIRFLTVAMFAVIAFATAKIISPRILASESSAAGVWAGILILSFFLWMFFPYVLQAKKNFIGSVSVDLSFMGVRLLALFLLVATGATLYKVFGAFVAGGVASGLVGFWLVGTSFLREKLDTAIFKKLMRFSGWMGVSRVISSVSGGLDIQMLAAMLGAMATGLYSIPSRLASFVIVLSGSFSSVLATRLAGFGDKKVEREYILKACLTLVPLILGILAWIVFARPFILILFGAKYLQSVGVLQALLLAVIPFVLTIPSVTAIIYAIKKPKFVGSFAIFQVSLVFISNYFLIPKFGVFGPTITLGIINTILAVYSWVIVFKHYWLENG